MLGLTILMELPWFLVVKTFKILRQSKEVNDCLNVIFYLHVITLSEISNAHLHFQIIFPYDEFVEFFNWDKPGFPLVGI